MKKTARRLAIATFALMASAGVVSLPNAAHADSGWNTRIHVTSQR